MIGSVIQFFRALRGSAKRTADPSELLTRLEELKQRNAELEQSVRTHRKAAEELRRYQADLDRTQRLARIGNWRWSVPRQELIDTSRSFAEIHGIDASEIATLIENHIERDIHPEDSERVERAIRGLGESGTEYEIEYRIIRPDGQIRHIHEVGENISDDSGVLIEQMGTVQDVTELKLAEEALRKTQEELEQRVRTRTAELLDANAALQKEVAERKRAEAEREEREMLLQSAARISKVGYGVWDELEHRYLNISDEFAHIVDLTVAEFKDHFRSSVEDFEAVHPDDRERYRAYEQAYSSEPAITQIEYRMTKRGGEIVHVRELMQPIFDHSGRLIQSIITNQDITEQKQTEEQLRQAQKMEAVGQLTGGIAHDFNNLLAVIVGNLELVEGEIDKATQASEWVETAIAAAERGAGLTQRLLAFSRKQALRPIPVDANSLVQGMLDLLCRTLGERIEIELVRDAELWQCLVDPNQLENAILNLAINARDAMPNGGKLAIKTSNAWIDDDCARVHADVSPGEYVLVTVSDTGNGMTKDVQQRAFEPFYTTKDVGRGSGLGLSMVYGFLKQSGGHVSVHSEVGVGTTVRLFLSRYSGVELPKSPATDSSSILKARGQVVLVVEDDADLRSLVMRVLQSLGYGVLEANSAAPALEILRSTVEIDLLLSDVVLPDRMSGVELVAEALRLRSDLRVIYMSGYTEESILHQRHFAEGIQFLQKPFRMMDIARAAREALASRGASR